MKGLKEYIAKHGKHLTTKLAINVIKCRWNSSEIERATEKVVYYNISEATLGDMVLMVNHFNSCFIDVRKNECIRWALGKVGDMNANGYAFDILIENYSDVDLTKYI